MRTETLLDEKLVMDAAVSVYDGNQSDLTYLIEQAESRLAHLNKMAANHELSQFCMKVLSNLPSDTPPESIFDIYYRVAVKMTPSQTRDNTFQQCLRHLKDIKVEEKNDKEEIESLLDHMMWISKLVQSPVMQNAAASAWRRISGALYGLDPLFARQVIQDELEMHGPELPPGMKFEMKTFLENTQGLLTEHQPEIF